jgi:hypothetical protein
MHDSHCALVVCIFEIHFVPISFPIRDLKLYNSESFEEE